ncbi:carboxypeptidase-like regulatory domain-containing protein [Algoriphagus boritolerans]|uniref:CarboxypepD_reg-like domain-containing protein n=1 Tax=Algoriphagus boritolerans DSM 17298 = JCM 18970 TaxID=1120964 RepID=A0A1H5TVL9_9BACT|nr:carboxypeptidase-like regulatory domain-containing protein [Algoriphagus boritolerans]SEF66027.1 CarboxypepD_reg-like domain-containing protein [Algoriphagus boritolerans DSM 17298 = JCM 18970]
MTLFRTGWILTILWTIPQLLLGQNFSLSGRVLDFDTKEYIEGASITLRNTAFGDFSNGAGNFSITNILSEKYTLAIKLPGYNTYEQVVNLKADLNLGNIYLVKFGSEGTGVALQKTIRATNVSRLLVERPNFIGNTVYGIPPEPKKLEGNFYLDTKWNVASILLYRDQTVLEGFRVRYNINSNMFELMEPENNLVTTMPGIRIQNIVWMDSAYKVPRYFVNGMDFKEDNTPISGFFEVLVEGNLPLMRRTKAIFKESNYNTALMVGNRNDQIIKRNVYYYLKGKDLFEVPKKRKDLFKIFGEKAKEMEEFVEENEMDLKKNGSIFQLFTYYNSRFPDFVPIMDQLLDEGD